MMEKPSSSFPLISGFGPAGESALITGIAAAAMLAAATGWQGFWSLAALMFLAYLALLLPRLQRRELPLLLGALISAGAVLWLHDAPFQVLRRSLETGVSFGALLLALGFLGAPASVSALVRHCGEYLIHQGPGRRYLALSGGAHLFGVVLNLGTLMLLGGMVARSNTLAAAGGDPEVVEIRSRRMGLALLRGLAANSLWAPTTVTVAVCLTLLPQVPWLTYLPIGLALAAAYMTVGFVLDRMEHSQRVRFRAQVEPSRFTAQQVLLPMIGLVLGVLLLIAAGRLAFGWGLNQAVTLAVPVFAIAWLIWQGKARGPRIAALITGRQVIRHCVERLPKSRFEMISLTAAGVMGGCLAALIPPTAIAHVLEVSGLPPYLLLLAVSLIILGSAQIGFNPVVSITLLGTAIARMDPLPVPPLALLLTLIGSWNLFGPSSPFSAAALILGNILGKPSRTLTHRWNWRYVMICFTLLQATIGGLVWLA